jgi:hypothetical protein
MSDRKPPYWPHRCRFCNRFVGNVRAWANDDGLTDVRGVCKVHGDVGLEGASWNYDLFTFSDGAA